MVKKYGYIDEPRCIICDTIIEHEWLDGDYSLLICNRKKCLKKFWSKSLDEQMAMNDESQDKQRNI